MIARFTIVLELIKQLNMATLIILKPKNIFTFGSRVIFTTEIIHRKCRFIRTICILGKLAALWPFLGICAEVFVLCAIILIYEKRRNKAELEESDTDQSPEQ